MGGVQLLFNRNNMQDGKVLQRILLNTDVNQWLGSTNSPINLIILQEEDHHKRDSAVAFQILQSWFLNIDPLHGWVPKSGTFLAMALTWHHAFCALTSSEEFLFYLSGLNTHHAAIREHFPHCVLNFAMLLLLMFYPGVLLYISLQLI